MKPDIHPEYRPVVFADQSSDFAMLTRSTIAASDTIEWEDGNTYPLVKVEITSASHPFYTGKMKLVDTAGRVEKFRTRYKDGVGDTKRHVSKRKLKAAVASQRSEEEDEA